MSSEVNIFDSTAKKVFYGSESRYFGATPGIGLVAFFFNHYRDETWHLNSSGSGDLNIKLTDKERMATHYFRWRELTTSLSLTAVLLFIILFAFPDISTAIKVKLAIAGSAIGFASILTGCVAYYYKRKALDSNTVTHPSPKGFETEDL